MKETNYIYLYNGNEPFINCTCTNKRKYSINHNPKPLVLPKELVEAIEMLLWYAPNVTTSAQSYKNEYLNTVIYEDAVIEYFLEYLELQPTDITFIPDEYLTAEIVKPYLNEACLLCHKLILTKQANTSKFTCILRHLRNCLAHGRFSFVSENEIIGFDKKDGKYTGVIKVNIISLKKFCDQLFQYPDFTIARLFHYVLLKNFYKTLLFVGKDPRPNRKNPFEEIVLARKNEIAISINCSRYLHSKKIKNINETIDMKIDYDEEFGLSTHYICIYYQENQKELMKKVANEKYLMGKDGLNHLFSGGDIIDLIEAAME